MRYSYGAAEEGGDKCGCAGRGAGGMVEAMEAIIGAMLFFLGCLVGWYAGQQKGTVEKDYQQFRSYVQTRYNEPKAYIAGLSDEEQSFKDSLPEDKQVQIL